MKKHLLLLFLLFPVLAFTLDESQKIDFLINKVRKSQAVFIRNGEEHKAEEAAKHLKLKLNKATKMFWFFGPKKDVSAREFIEKIASHSSTTGKPYLIRKKGEKKAMEIKPWLYEKLKSLKNN